MQKLLAKIREFNKKKFRLEEKCQLVAEVYGQVSPFLPELDSSADVAELDVSKFDSQLDEIEVVLNEMEQLLISPEIKELLIALEKRFKGNMKRHPKVSWQQVEQKLKQAPKEKLRSLLEMEKTGGEPDVIKIDKETSEVIFYDCSAETPTGRRNCVYDLEAEIELKKGEPNVSYNGNAVDMASKMGVELLTEAEYRELQTKGEFDTNWWTWVATPIDIRRESFALDGRRAGDRVLVVEHLPSRHHDRKGWRGSLRV